MADSSGQASVELIAALPVVLLAALVALQLFAAGAALTLADGAAEAGALALAAGERLRPPSGPPSRAGRRTTSR